MIRPIQITLNAAHPELPLIEASTYVGSPSTAFVRGVPAAIGNWKITAVRVIFHYPDESVVAAACVNSATGVWVGTIAPTATSGRVANGYQVIADGTDENGDAVTGYVLGMGDLAVYTRDMTIDAGETVWYLHYFDTAPTTPKKGDVATVDGVLKLYNGTAWESFAAGITLDDAVTRTSANGVKSSGIWAAIWGALAALPTGFASLYDWCVEQLSGKASTADTTLTARGPNHDGFSAWECSLGAGYHVEWYNGGQVDPGWHIVEDETGSPVTDPKGDANSISLSWTGGVDAGMDCSATRTALPGYQLGSQSTKPIASEAEAEALRQGKQDALSSTQLANIADVPNKADASDLRYAIVTKTYSSGVAMDDRAINGITISSGTTATLSLPPQVSNKSRDFYIVVGGNSDSDMVVTVTGAYLINPDMSAATLTVPAGTVRAWRLTEQMNGISALSVPATFIVTGANFQDALNDIAAGLDAVIGTGGDVPVVYPIDSALSPTSTNPVENRVITAALSGYAFHAATVSSGTTPTVTDLAIRAINSATLGSTVTAATVTLPAAVSGRSRDFFLELTIEASTAPTIEFIDPATGTTANVTFGADSLADIDSGKNAIHFTEYPNYIWLVSVKHEESRLPYDAEVEYLESTGTQYIDTGINPSTITYFKTKISTASLDMSSNKCVLGGGSFNAYAWLLVFQDNGQFRYYGNGTKLSDITQGEEATFEVEASQIATDSMAFVCKKNDVQTFTGNLASQYTVSGNLYLFSMAGGGYASNRLRIHYVTTNAVDLIPVRVGSVGYMYDRVSGALFGNAGTGAFTVGPDK